MKPIPSITDLQLALANDFKNKLNLSDNDLKQVLNAFDIVVSAQFKLLYLFLSDIQNNVFPDTADLEVNGGTLERIGRIQIGRNPLPATVGVFNLSVSGVAGSVLRSELTFKSNEGSKNPGQMFVLDAEYILTGTDDIIEVRSLGSGTEYDLNVGDNLTITEPIIGVDATVTVNAVTEQPKAQEDIETYRRIVLDSIQLEPQGGAKTDYRLWSADAQGVRKVYPYVKIGEAGTVQLFIEANLVDSIDGKGTPSGTLITDVSEVVEFDPDITKPLNERGRRPIQANMEFGPISLIPVDVQVIGLSQNNATISASIESGMSDYLYGIRPFISGADLTRDKNDILYKGKLQSVVNDVLGNSNFFTSFVMIVGGVSVDSYTFDLGNIPYLRNVTY